MSFLGYPGLQDCVHEIALNQTDVRFYGDRPEDWCSSPVARYRPRSMPKRGWTPRTSFEEMIHRMVESDLELLRSGAPQKQAG